MHNMFDPYINPYPTNIFFPENFVCLLHLLHVFKCTPEHSYMVADTMDPFSQAKGTKSTSFLTHMRKEQVDLV